MESNDPLRLQARAIQPTVFDDDVQAASGAVAAEHSSVPMDPGLMVPTTPPRTFSDESPRAITTTRHSDGGGDAADAKRQRISKIQREY